jgi:hypothetical protein
MYGMYILLSVKRLYLKPENKHCWPKGRWKDNIEMDIILIGFDDIDRIYVT